jgi:soluble lytic murein transglycosylase
VPRWRFGWLAWVGGFGLLGSLAFAGAFAAPEGPAALAGPIARPGPALARAVRDIEAGRSEEAQNLLLAIREQHPIVGDYADLLHVRLLVEAERYDEAIALRDTATADGPLTRVELLDLVGQAHAALGEEEPARELWERAADATPSRERAATLHTTIAESFLRSDNLEGAAKTYRRIWIRYPELPASAAAERGLDTLEPELGRTLRDAASTLSRADKLYGRYRNEPALAAYDRAIALGLSSAKRKRAEEGRAAALFRLRRYPEAALAYSGLPSTEKREIQRARAHARAGDVPRGARELEILGRGSRTAQGTRALLISALLWDGEDAHERATRLFRMVIERAPRSEAAGVALWQLGWGAFRDGRYAEARGHFDALASNESDAVAALRPRYWSLRAQERSGDVDVAFGYAQLAREFPLTYYGWRARKRSVNVTGPLREPLPVTVGTRALRPEDLRRVRILIEAGLDELARGEMRRLDGRARGLDDRLALGQLHANLGSYDRAQRLALDAYNESLARGPVPGQIDLWWHAWPAPFEAEMAEAAAAGMRLEPGLVYAIMREESGYQPGVVSAAGARGLLQLMPETAERVARDVALDPFDVQDLFLPRVNILLGSAYLEGLVRRFDGRHSAAIGSYNAGPHVMARWIAKGPREDDEFVEEIPYNETRNYVKRVLRSLHAYRVLY